MRPAVYLIPTIVFENTCANQRILYEFNAISGYVILIALFVRLYPVIVNENRSCYFYSGQLQNDTPSNLLLPLLL